MSRCADADALLAEVAPPTTRRWPGRSPARFADAIARADAEIGSGRYRRAGEIFLALREQPELPRHPPTDDRWSHGLGTAAFSSATTAAREQFADAHWIALAAGADDMALTAGRAAQLADSRTSVSARPGASGRARARPYGPHGPTKQPPLPVARARRPGGGRAAVRPRLSSTPARPSASPRRPAAVTASPPP